MLHLLKVEWMKIKSYKAFKVFSVLYIVSLIVSLFIFHAIYDRIMLKATGSSALGDVFTPFSFPALWTNAAFFMGFLVYLPGMIVINLCVNEFNFKTHRQNIIDGWSRKQFFTSKILVLLVFSLVITLIYCITLLVFSQIVGIPFSFEGAEKLLLFFLQTFSYLLFAFTLAILFRKSGVAIILFFIYGLILDNALWGLLNWKMHPVGYFLPLQISDLLTPLYVKGFGSENLSIYDDMPNIGVVVSVVIAYCCLFIYLAYKKFVKDDL
jgi:ABC-2 type transport system permease protein